MMLFIAPGSNWNSTLLLSWIQPVINQPKPLGEYLLRDQCKIKGYT